MQSGRIEQYGTPDELYRSPRTPWVAGFVGEANFVVGTVTDEAAAEVAATPIGIISINDHRTDQTEGQVQVLVRPEQIALAAWSDADDSLVGEAATVAAVEYYGHDVRYELELDDGTTLAARTHSTELFARGDRVVATFQRRQRNSQSAAFSIGRPRPSDDC